MTNTKKITGLLAVALLAGFVSGGFNAAEAQTSASVTVNSSVDWAANIVLDPDPLSTGADDLYFGLVTGTGNMLAGETMVVNASTGVWSETIVAPVAQVGAHRAEVGVTSTPSVALNLSCTFSLANFPGPMANLRLQAVDYFITGFGTNPCDGTTDVYTPTATFTTYFGGTLLKHTSAAAFPTSGTNALTGAITFNVSY